MGQDERFGCTKRCIPSRSHGRVCVGRDRGKSCGGGWISQKMAGDGGDTGSSNGHISLGANTVMFLYLLEAIMSVNQTWTVCQISSSDLI